MENSVKKNPAVTADIRKSCDGTTKPPKQTLANGAQRIDFFSRSKPISWEAHMGPDPGEGIGKSLFELVKECQERPPRATVPAAPRSKEEVEAFLNAMRSA